MLNIALRWNSSNEEHSSVVRGLIETDAVREAHSRKKNRIEFELVAIGVSNLSCGQDLDSDV